MIASCAMQKRLPTAREYLAIFLVIIGTFFIATHGNISNMIINTSGLIWGLLAAVALALYTLIPGNITKQYSSITITGYGMLLGGIVLAVLSQAWKVQLSSDFRFIAAFAGIPIYANHDSVLPIVQVLLMKGVPVGTTIVMLMSITAISLPEMIMLHKVLNKKMLWLFVGYLLISFIIVGYLMNATLILR